ncbi:HNH endonuclease signature motif containing protein [uncultured Duncaniella sp.]|jgi:HNH endonuclease.|uniref:HNH endonuclease signature motif containing protein n=1 Tax=uncultured Duncaniella sp. TaxID=2768039 RepID=UPI0025B695C9|nr:HNH endonuclease signature motif containing protein [uncultured Duncaniella sp.]
MDKLIESVWNRARQIEHRNPDVWRQDFAGAWIRRDQYGVMSKFGWVIDHIKPKSMNGDDSLDNLQALHWKNNISKGNNYLEVETCVTSEGLDNIHKQKKWKLNILK